MIYTDKYDFYFKAASDKEFPRADIDFQKQFKAQAIAESALNPMAISPVGAKGLMQIMPRTFIEQCSKNGIKNGDPFNTETSIRLGINYDKYLYNKQTSKRPLSDRMAFTLASYNAGLGTILKAQKFCMQHRSDLNPNLQSSITEIAKYVRSQKEQETLHYVSIVFEVYDKLINEKNNNIDKKYIEKLEKEIIMKVNEYKKITQKELIII